MCCFKAGDAHFWMAQQAAGRQHPVGQRGKFLVILERVARGDQHPERIEIEPAQCLLDHEPMTFMYGIEAAPKQPNAHARAGDGQFGDAGNADGMTQGQMTPRP